ncbi:MAG: d(CMP) kinase [Rhodospirillaceae bacterium]
MPPTIAIDGPAASGKGTLSKRLAGHYGFAHLDTGSLYRAVGLMVVWAGGDPADPEMALAGARALTPGSAILTHPDLRHDAAAKAASLVAAMPEVRAALLDFQHDFIANPPGGRGSVLDGRDIGTVVCPEAPAKLFVTASVEVRAERRVKELRAAGQDVSVDAVLMDMKARDERDSRRAVAPLKSAVDAFVLDTSNLDADQAFDAARAFLRTRIGPA